MTATDSNVTQNVAPQAAATQASSAPDSAAQSARTAGRGGLAITFSKLYFLVLGLAQNIVLPALLGPAGFGQLRTALSPASITYNPVITAGIQGVSRAVVGASEDAKEAAVWQTLRIHGALACVIALVFCVLAPPLIGVLGAPHVARTVRLLSLVVLLYGLYAPLIGVLNGRQRFLHQAGFDIFATTLRTAGLLLGAWIAANPDQVSAAVEGAVMGFVGSSSVVFLLAVFVVGTGKRGPGAPSVKEHLRFLAPLMIGQAVLNLLLQADTTTLRFFASRAATGAGLDVAAADDLVGAYAATQLFGFLPYQLLIGITFVLFPLLAHAHQQGDSAGVATYVKAGVRVALIVAGLIVSVSSGLAAPLMRLVYFSRPSFAELGAEPMQLLTLGMGWFAVFGVLITVLNSLKQELTGMWITAGGFGLVLLMNWLLVAGKAFGPELLWWTALSTSLGLLAATAAAAWAVFRVAGAVVAPLTLMRVIVAVAISVTVARALPSASKLLTLVESAGVGCLFLLLLTVSQELTRKDLGFASRVLARGKR